MGSGSVASAMFQIAPLEYVNKLNEYFMSSLYVLISLSVNDLWTVLLFKLNCFVDLEFRCLM